MLSRWRLDYPSGVYLLKCIELTLSGSRGNSKIGCTDGSGHIRGSTSFTRCTHPINFAYFTGRNPYISMNIIRDVPHWESLGSSRNPSKIFLIKYCVLLASSMLQDLIYYCVFYLSWRLPPLHVSVKKERRISKDYKITDKKRRLIVREDLIGVVHQNISFRRIRQIQWIFVLTICFWT